MKLSNRAYDILKWIALIFLPAVGALYFTLAQVWDFERTPGINGTINAIITFLGVVLGISNKKYRDKKGEEAEDNLDGELYVTQLEGETAISLGINGSVDRIASKDTVRLRVDTRSDEI